MNALTMAVTALQELTTAPMTTGSIVGVCHEHAAVPDGFTRLSTSD